MTVSARSHLCTWNLSLRRIEARKFKLVICVSLLWTSLTVLMVLTHLLHTNNSLYFNKYKVTSSLGSSAQLTDLSWTWGCSTCLNDTLIVFRFRKKWIFKFKIGGHRPRITYAFSLLQNLKFWPFEDPEKLFAKIALIIIQLAHARVSAVLTTEGYFSDCYWPHLFFSYPLMMSRSLVRPRCNLSTQLLRVSPVDWLSSIRRSVCEDFAVIRSSSEIPRRGPPTVVQHESRNSPCV